MQIRFDPNQEYQREAVRAVTDLFAGHPRQEDPPAPGAASRLLLPREALLQNLRAVQARAGLPLSEALDAPEFSVEMETGTGKTYVYLRTLHELRARFGFRKFIIVVPSVAIREGVLKSIELTRAHFEGLYGGGPVDAWVYRSGQVSRLREFAASRAMQLLILNIDAFNKKEIAVIHRESDALSGRRPVEFLQAARPIVVLDEPQNMESPLARAAIADLSPLATLRYSATHRRACHLVYRLDPARAWDLRLVKQIEVASVLEEAAGGGPYVRLLEVSVSRGRLRARLEIDAAGPDGPQRRTVTARRAGDDLFHLSRGRECYRGWTVAEIDAGEGVVRFGSGVTLNAGETHGGDRDARMRVQIRETVRAHLEKELAVRGLPPGRRVKVLSLFFIDRVASYAAEDGKLRRWFLEAYGELAALPRYAPLRPPPAERAHGGYFAQDRGRPRDSREGRTTRADQEVYALILRDRERLLSPEEPLRFLFSHSALREGWDNPNVFQICTLNESRSEIRKRQEIGRGLRLPVREDGERCRDPELARLTVIANESYREFAARLQAEIEAECGVPFAGRVRPARERRALEPRPGWREDPDLLALWARVGRRTRCEVRFATEDLIAGAAARLAALPILRPPRLRVTRAALVRRANGFAAEAGETAEYAGAEPAAEIPDLLALLQRETGVTRVSLAEILVRSGRLAEVPRNPQQFLDQALGAVREVLETLLAAGARYATLPGELFPLERLAEAPLHARADRLLPARRSLYDALPWETEAERDLAAALDAREDVRLFFRLPPWFEIETPLGGWTPGWAVVCGPDPARFLLLETGERGGAGRSRERRLRCAAAWAAAVGVELLRVRSADEVPGG